MIVNFSKKNILYFIGIFAVLFIPILYSEVFHVNLHIYGSFSISYFGIISLLYFLGKIIFSVLNTLEIKKINKSELTTFPKVGVQVTGWKEDKELFKNTLLALKYQTYKNIEKITFCSDGNDKDDEYLGEIFMEVFPDGKIFKNEKTFYNMNEEERKTFLDSIKDIKHLCILQPHAGKRHGMYTQMKIYNSMDNIDLIMLNDSDCIYSRDAIELLVKTQVKKDLDGVTGDVKIYNVENLTSYLISLKFWYAMNFERNAQSYFNCVGCLPGPFGLYKNSSIKKIIDIWIDQKLFGKECTFGDDRHLTNLILMNNGKLGYNYAPKCYTDTPTTIQRFATQQTRWGKSFLREYIVNINSFRFDTLWLSFEQTFVFFIVYYVIYLMVSNFYNMNLNNILLIYSSLIIFGYIRSLIGIISSRKMDFIIFPLYGYLYFYILFPVKLWTLFTFNITSWGTGSRMNKSFKIIDFLFIIIWFLFTSIFIGLSIYYDWNNLNYFTIGLISFIILNTLFLVLLFKYYFLKKTRKEFKNELDKIINYNENIEVVIQDINKIEEMEIELR